MGGASGAGGALRIPPANRTLSFDSPCWIGRSEIILRIWEAGCGGGCFYLLCATLNGLQLSVSECFNISPDINRFQGANSYFYFHNSRVRCDSSCLSLCSLYAVFLQEYLYLSFILCQGSLQAIDAILHFIPVFITISSFGNLLKPSRVPVEIHQSDFVFALFFKFL